VLPAADAVAARLATRIARAETLAGRHPAAAEVLTCYAAVATWQQQALVHAPAVLPRGADVAAFADALDPAAAAALVPALVGALAAAAPAALVRATRTMTVAPADWAALCRDAWRAPTGVAGPEGEAARFLAEAVLQPFAEVVAGAAAAPAGQMASGDATRCRTCGGVAVAGVLREHGHGAGRSLVCGLCASEWRVPRAVCPACAEVRVEQLPVFRDETWPAVRLEACDTCHVAVKTIDRSVDGHADPVVDDLAALPLDLWAASQHYRRLRPALLRV
jgi:FdhE protein